jgi:hypothetical protein
VKTREASRGGPAKLYSHKKRPVLLGPYPLEWLPRVDDPAAPIARLGALPSRPVEARGEGLQQAGHADATYEELFDQFRSGNVAPAAPIPDDPDGIADNLKAGRYFLDADIIGCGTIPDDTWTGERHPHRFAVVIVIGHTRDLGTDQPGEQWVSGTGQRNADLRAAELSVIIAGDLRNIGHEAVAHTPRTTDLDLGLETLQAGVIDVRGRELRAPYVSGGFAVAAVSTDLEFSPHRLLPRQGLLAELRSTKGLGSLFSHGGRAVIARLNGDHRPHRWRYPMEKIKRVDQPTTLIVEDEVRGCRSGVMVADSDDVRVVEGMTYFPIDSVDMDTEP